MDSFRHRLDIFDIPADTGGQAVAAVRDILARLLAAGALSLGELQTARDLVGLAPEERRNPHTYLFLAAMFLSLAAGNTYLRDDTDDGRELLGRGGFLGDGEDAAFRQAVDGLWEEAAAAAEKIASPLERLPDEPAAVAGLGPVIRVGRSWYFQRHLEDVLAVRQAVKARQGGACLREKKVPESFCTFTGSDGQPFTLNAGQTAAVNAAVSRPLTVITGGPGTGKTTVVCSLVAALLNSGEVTAEDIALAAPTGRAAQRMGEALHAQAAAAAAMPPAVKAAIDRLNGTTIHRLLGGYAPRWEHTADTPLPHRLVVVDEASMVDVGLMAALLAALPEPGRLVLLGDKDQLPAVGAGAVLGDFVAKLDRGEVKELTESKRFVSGKEHSLGWYAEKINGGGQEENRRTVMAAETSAGVQELCGTTGPGARQFFWWRQPGNDPRKNREGREERLEQWARHFGWLGGGRDTLAALAAALPPDDPALTANALESAAAKKLFAALNRARVLCVVRDGGNGADGVNRFLAGLRCGKKEPLACAGVPVIVTRNTPERNLFNGDIGVTVPTSHGMAALFPRGEQTVVCPTGLLPEHGFAYAITVHKSQGSEFDHALVVLPDNADNPLLTRQLLYTGITRARRVAGVLGSAEALDTALRTKTERRTGVME